jgi:DNA-binding MarR family transcriptional regulator
MERPDLPVKEAVELCLNFNVRKAARVITKYYNAALQPSGLLSTQFSILVALSFGGPMSISALADILVTDRTTLARNLNPLDRDGYLNITRADQDKRQKIVEITWEGEHVLGRALPLWAQAQAGIKSQLGDDSLVRMKSEITELVSLLQG